MVKKLMALFVRYSPLATPKNANGRAIKISNGCKMLLNRIAIKIIMLKNSGPAALPIDSKDFWFSSSLF
jgi:hypothetical protein